MSEPKVEEKKVVRRSVAIALGIVCIILIASMVAVVTIQSISYTEKEAEIAHQLLRLWHDGTLSISLGDVNNLLQSDVLWKNKTITEPTDSYRTFTLTNYINNSGYLTIDLTTAYSTEVYVGITYDSGYIRVTNMSRFIYGTASFPVVPCPSVEIGFGNFASGGNQTLTVTVTYYY